MKKYLAVLLCVLFLAGCSSGVSRSEYNAVVAERDALKLQLEGLSQNSATQTITQTTAPETTQEAKKASPDAFDAESIAANITVEEYSYINSIKTSWSIFLLTNNSSYDLSAEINFILKDANGGMIGAKNEKVNAFENGKTVAVCIMNETEPASIDYEITVKEETYYECVLSDLSHEVTTTEEKAIIAVKNNGTEAADFVQYTALFFKGGKLINHGTGYTIDDDNELKPGKTIVKEERCFADFDDAKIYLTGRR